MLKRQKHLLLSLLVFAKKKDQLHSEGKETWGCPGTALRSGTCRKMVLGR